MRSSPTHNRNNCVDNFYVFRRPIRTGSGLHPESAGVGSTENPNRDPILGARQTSPMVGSSRRSTTASGPTTLAIAGSSGPFAVVQEEERSEPRGMQDYRIVRAARGGVETEAIAVYLCLRRRSGDLLAAATGRTGRGTEAWDVGGLWLVSPATQYGHRTSWYRCGVMETVVNCHWNRCIRARRMDKNAAEPW